MRKTTPIANKENIVKQSEILDNRRKLREYCRQNNIETPDFFASNLFVPISMWAMKKNIFPLCIKTSKNLNNNNSIFILKAFRELPQFFETIQSKNENAEILIEEFIEGRAQLEVTLLHSQIRLITQVSFSQSMKLVTKWRGFPVKLPNSIFNKIESIITKFNEIIQNSSTPIRFSFVVKNAVPILLSINQDNNRLEYQPEWRKSAKLELLAESSYPPQTTWVSKINIYHGIKNPDLDFSLAENICQLSKAKWEIKGSKLYFMLTSKDLKSLAEDFEKVDAIVKQVIDYSKNETTS